MTLKRSLMIGLLLVWLCSILAGVYTTSLKGKLREAEFQAERARIEKNEAIEALAIAKRSAAASIQALAAVHKAEQARAKTMNALRGDINNAPQTDDGPLAPVLRRALDGLRPE